MMLWMIRVYFLHWREPSDKKMSIPVMEYKMQPVSYIQCYYLIFPLNNDLKY